MRGKTSFERREVLKKSAAGLSLLSTVGTAAARGRGRDRYVHFDPEDKEELKSFLDRLRNASADKEQKLFDELSKQEKDAVIDGIRPAEYAIENDVTVLSSDPPHTVPVTAKSTLKNDLWTLYHQIDWEPFNANLPIESDAWVTASDALYDSDGIVDSQSWVDGWEARKVGRVESTFNVDYGGISAGFVATPVVHLYGQNDGGYGVIEKEDGQ